MPAVSSGTHNGKKPTIRSSFRRGSWDETAADRSRYCDTSQNTEEERENDEEERDEKEGAAKIKNESA